MIAPVARVRSVLDEVGAVRGISILVQETASSEKWFPPWPYMAYDFPFASDMVRIREKGNIFEGLYHRTEGLVLPCIFPSISVLDKNLRLLLVSRPRTHLRNLVCGISGKLLFAGLVRASIRRTKDPLVSKCVVKVKGPRKGNKTHELLILCETDKNDRFNRVITRIY